MTIKNPERKILIQIIKQEINKLIPADYDPHKGLKPGDPEFEKLKRLIHEFGYVDPIIWNKQTGHVIGGHQRSEILQGEGLTEVGCVVVDFDGARKKALDIALNRISDAWSQAKLGLLISDLEASASDVSLAGSDESEIADLLETNSNAKDDNFDADAELRQPTFSQAGGIWHLGRHTLSCSDATKAESYQELLGKTQVNLVLTGPPYNVDYQSKVDKIKDDHQANDKFYQFLLGTFQNMNQAVADNASIYVFHADTEELNFRRTFQDVSFYLSGCCIWRKQSLVLGRSSCQWQHGPILYGWRKTGKHEWYTDCRESTIWEFDKPKKSREHPAMKPIPLLTYPIMNLVMTNCTVLSPFGSSGSILIACERTKRTCFMMELGEKYCDVITKRYIEQVGSTQDVSMERYGETIPYSEVVKRDK